MAVLAGRGLSASTRAAAIQSVIGPVEASALGVTLMHEHLLVDFIGAEKVSRSRRRISGAIPNWGCVLVSHDAGWYHVGEPGGGTFRAFDTLFTELVPALRRAGLSDGDVRALLVENPRRALTPAATA